MPRLTHHARRELVRERQQQILQAAAQVFSAKGFASATIRDIARAAHLSEGSIYLYFKNKQDLLVRLPHQFMQPPIEAFQTAALRAEQSPPPQALLEFMAQNIVRIITKNRELVRILFTSLPTMDEATRATYMREVPAYALDVLETYVRAQQAAGVFRSDVDPEIAARMFPGMMMFFLFIQEIIQPGDMPRFEYDSVIPNVVKMFLHGIMTPAPSVSDPEHAPAAVEPKTRRAPRRKQSIRVE